MTKDEAEALAVQVCRELGDGWDYSMDSDDGTSWDFSCADDDWEIYSFTHEAKTSFIAELRASTESYSAWCGAWISSASPFAAFQDAQEGARELLSLLAEKLGYSVSKL